MATEVRAIETKAILFLLELASRSASGPMADCARSLHEELKDACAPPPAPAPGDQSVDPAAAANPVPVATASPETPVDPATNANQGSQNGEEEEDNHPPVEDLATAERLANAPKDPQPADPAASQQGNQAAPSDPPAPPPLPPSEPAPAPASANTGASADPPSDPAPDAPDQTKTQ